jgi:membrane-bound serine protease (ClpP class)
MNKIYTSFVFFFLSLVIVSSSTSVKAQDTDKKLVYKFNIKEEIGPPVWRTTKNALKEAKELSADYVLIHMNTYGGRMDAADSIRTALMQFPVPIFVYIDNNAASAGALISIACDSIYMRPGGNIGAATVVDQKGEVVADKYQSYMRSLMRSTAEATGRNPEIAQAMVDPRIEIENVIDSGSVLTFTVNEAIKHGFCEGKAESIAELIKLSGIENYEIVEQTISPLDTIIGFFINPVISGILIMLIIGGIYFELQSPGIGFPLIASILAALLYFSPLYLEGLAANWEILLFIIGVVLVAVEIFVIPGFGVTGVLGAICIISGLTLSMVDTLNFEGEFNNMDNLIKALFTVVIATFAAIVLSIKLSHKIFTSKAFGHLALASTQQATEGFTSSDITYMSMEGKIGVAHTNLRPSGKIIINGEHFDASAMIGFIDKGSKVKVVKYETAQLFVVKE